MTAMPDDADSCVRHQCERGGEDEERRGSFFVPERGNCCRFWHRPRIAKAYVCLV